MPIVFNGKLVVHKSGATQEDKTNMGRCDLIEPELIFRLSKHYEAGAKNHGDRNWEKGLSVGDCVSSIVRHTYKYLAGWKDEDHLAAIAWRVAAIMRYEKYNPECCDLPWQQVTTKEAPLNGGFAEPISTYQPPTSQPTLFDNCSDNTPTNN